MEDQVRIPSGRRIRGRDARWPVAARCSPDEARREAGLPAVRHPVSDGDPAPDAIRDGARTSSAGSMPSGHAEEYGLGGCVRGFQHDRLYGPSSRQSFLTDSPPVDEVPRVRPPEAARLRAGKGRSDRRGHRHHPIDSPPRREIMPSRATSPCRVAEARRTPTTPSPA